MVLNPLQKKNWMNEVAGQVSEEVRDGLGWAQPGEGVQ